MKDGLRVLILTPTVLPRMTGNAITAERWRRLLVARGVSVRIQASDDLPVRDMAEVMETFDPHLVHVHHASKSGRFFLDPFLSARYAGVPLVVSPAGTDISGRGNIHPGPAAALKVLRRAQVIIAQNSWFMPWCRQNEPALCSQVVHVSKSVLPMGNAPYDLRDACGARPEDVVFFHPAGIRPVKGNLECLLALEDVSQSRPRLRAVFAGPLLDVAYGTKFLSEIERLSGFARWIPTIPPEAMAAAYASADVVLNASFSEGLSNAILEAMTAGRPILASNIEGNRWPILAEADHSPCGILFDPGDRDDFRHQATKLIDDATLRAALGAAGRRRAAACFSSEAEAEGLLSVYEMAIGRQSG